jgi:hypothetical protein
VLSAKSLPTWLKAALKRSNDMKTYRNETMILLVRSFHSLFALLFLSCIAYIYYCALTNRRDGWLWFAVGTLLLEGGVVWMNHGDCPLGPLHHRYGDDKAFFELFMPKRAAKLAIPFFSVVTVLGIALLFVR